MLNVEKLYKCYRIAGRQKVILDGIDLFIGKGEICSITGKSGCGKTTLLNVISGIVKPDSGSVAISDSRIQYSIDLLSSRRRNRDMGFVFQTFRLLPNESVLSNVYLPARIRGKLNRETREYIDEILSRLKIYKYRGMKANVLSGGQKQRVALARALANRPKVILADEPTANLDKKTSMDIFDIILELKEEGKAILIVTHKEYMHNQSNYVYSLENGILEVPQ